MWNVPRNMQEGSGPARQACPLPNWIASDQVVGMAVQLPLLVPKFAVAELQVQP